MSNHKGLAGSSMADCKLVESSATTFSWGVPQVPEAKSARTALPTSKSTARSDNETLGFMGEPMYVRFGAKCCYMPQGSFATTTHHTNREETDLSPHSRFSDHECSHIARGPAFRVTGDTIQNIANTKITSTSMSTLPYRTLT